MSGFMTTSIGSSNLKFLTLFFELASLLLKLPAQSRNQHSAGSEQLIIDTLTAPLDLSSSGCDAAGAVKSRNKLKSHTNTHTHTHTHTHTYTHLGFAVHDLHGTLGLLQDAVMSIRHTFTCLLHKPALRAVSAHRQR